jgi:hypothetical protein
MRLWSLHPRYLDRQGLLALWREALLAQKVIAGDTVGYRHHPQLERFLAAPSSSAAIATYLHTVCDEGARRGYRFDRTRIAGLRTRRRLAVTSGQILFEREHLIAKLETRTPSLAQQLVRDDRPQPNTSMRVVPGTVEPWEKAARTAAQQLRPRPG